MENNNEEKWEIKKIGIINYWWYDEEEFAFDGGRMILRGTNGSGKSVTMTSFIPLLFDGKKTADRFDAFGNKSRRLEDYVLGYGESTKEENTSYLYMEIYKPKLDRYFTVGMGLKAKKNQPLGFWGFIIKDGRRIGKDIFLYKDKKDKIPLTKSELTNKIGSGGQILSTQKEYMETVNKNIFGFKTITEYEDYIKLLLEIRKSKLSSGKDSKPSVVTGILNNSLGSLPDEDLRPVTESLDNMNKTKEQVEFLESSKKSLENILKVYNQYNECILYSKTKAYDNSNKNLKILNNEIIELEKRISKANEEIIINEQLQSEVVAKIEGNKYQLDNLKKDERFNIESDLIKLKQEVSSKTKIIEQKNLKSEEIKSKRIEKENKIKTINDKYDKELREIKEAIADASSLSNSIEFSEFEYFAIELEENKTVLQNFTVFLNNVKKFIQDINSVVELLRKSSELENVYENASEELSQLNKSALKQKETLQLKNKEFENIKKRYIDNMYIWEKNNKYFKIDSIQKASISTRIENYGEISTFDDILQSVNKPYNEIKSIFTTEKLVEENKIIEKEKEKEILEKELNEWKKFREPIPFREDYIKENRRKLEENNITCSPLYSCIDFKSDIDSKIKDIIESSLMDMGLLDALIISKKDHQKISKLDMEFVDKYLYANNMSLGPSILDFVNVEIPSNSSLTKEEIVNVLSEIKIGQNTSVNVHITKEGTYQIGLLSGKASKDILSKYIGRESKKRFKLEKIEHLKEQIKSLDNEVLNITEEINNIDTKQMILNNELLNFPTKKEIEEIHQELQELKSEEISYNNQIENKEKSCSILAQKCIEEKKKIKEYTDKFRYQIKYEVYKEMSKLAEELKDMILQIEKIHINSVHLYEMKSSINEEIESLDMQYDDILCEVNILEQEILTVRAKIKSSESIMDTDFLNKKKLFAMCLELEQTLPKEKEKLIQEIAVYQTQNEVNIKLLEDKKIFSNSLVIENKIYDDILSEELSLKYVYKDKISNETILEELKKFDKEGGINLKYSENLSNTFRENLENLIEYNMSIETIFNELNINDTDSQNLKEVKATRARRDIYCNHKGKKVNIISLKEDMEDTIIQLNLTLEKEDRELFEEILTNTIGRKIIERINYADRWVKQMNNLMENLKTSSELTFSLKWRPKVADDLSQMDTTQLVNILKSDSKLLKDEDRINVSKHFKNKFDKATKKYTDKDNIASFYNIMKETLDYRNWFEFELYYKQGIEPKKKLEDKSFFKLSGGEKAMAMYIPLFASIYAKYESASKDALRIISLDEAFAGVDDNNIRDMFKVLTNLELNYIINSQVLWGEYDTVPSLAINELVSSPSTQSVAVIRYKWNGYYKELVI